MFIVVGVKVVVCVVVVLDVLLLPVLHRYFVVLFLWFFDLIKFKLTLNFCNYSFGSVALFYFILQGIK